MIKRKMGALMLRGVLCVTGCSHKKTDTKQSLKGIVVSGKEVLQ